MEKEYTPKQKAARAKRFLNADGTPKYVACYMQKKRRTFDYITVVYTRLRLGYIMYVAMSEFPFHPQGFGQHEEAQYGKFCPGGSRVKFNELPPDCQKLVMQDYKELWNI